MSYQWVVDVINWHTPKLIHSFYSLYNLEKCVLLLRIAVILSLEFILTDFFWKKLIHPYRRWEVLFLQYHIIFSMLVLISAFMIFTSVIFIVLGLGKWSSMIIVMKNTDDIHHNYWIFLIFVQVIVNFHNHERVVSLFRAYITISHVFVFNFFN